MEVIGGGFLPSSLPPVPYLPFFLSSYSACKIDGCGDWGFDRQLTSDIWILVFPFTPKSTIAKVEEMLMGE